MSDKQRSRATKGGIRPYLQNILQSDSQLQKIKSGTVDSKLILFSNICIPNFVPFYLETNLSKSIKSKITQLRINCLQYQI
jgi:hypothetical protein